jgi:hypothetical protein
MSGAHGLRRSRAGALSGTLGICCRLPVLLRCDGEEKETRLLESQLLETI